jgi:polar amino acid transport system substrate-binding protein
MRTLFYIAFSLALPNFVYSATPEPSMSTLLAPHFRVCSLPLAPQTMPDANGKPTGYAVEILQQLARNLGWVIQIDYMPWARVDLETRHGQCDMAMTVLYFKDYAEYMRFPTEAILEQRNVLIVRSGSKIRYNGDLEAFMRQNSIGVYADKRVNDQFEQLRKAPWAKVDVVHTTELNVEKLLHKRFDALIENDLSAIYALAQTGHVNEVEILSPPLSITPAYIVFAHKPDPEHYLEQYDAELARFKKTPEFKQLSDKYLPASLTTQ